MSQKMLPLVSICVPIYNVAQYIERCAKSLFEQTYPNVEYIFVNDCSSDKSIEILHNVIASFPSKATQIHILTHELNRGLAAARNTAVAAAKGEFIIHVDSDDWVEPTLIEELLRIQQKTGADIVSCNGIAHFAERDILLEEPSYSSKEEMMRSIFKLTLDHVIWRRLIRTSLYKDNAIMAYEGHNIGEDHYTLPRLLYFADSFAKCDETLYHYNCMNEHSYMKSCRRMSFNYPKYTNDRDSLNILIDFFLQHDKAYLNDLNKIKAELVYEYIYPMVQTCDKEAYRMLCADWNTIDHNYLITPASLLSILTFHMKILRVFIILHTKRRMGTIRR